MYASCFCTKITHFVNLYSISRCLNCNNLAIRINELVRKCYLMKFVQDITKIVNNGNFPQFLENTHASGSGA